MAIHNVATVFGPNILRSADTSAIAMIQGTAAVNAITCDMIQNYEEIIEVRTFILRILTMNYLHFSFFFRIAKMILFQLLLLFINMMHKVIHMLPLLKEV